MDNTIKYIIKKRQRQNKLKKILSEINWQYPHRRGIVHQRVSLLLGEPLKNTLCLDIRAVLLEMGIRGINSHNYRWYKRIETIRRKWVGNGSIRISPQGQ